jgi:hypothetical protein
MNNTQAPTEGCNKRTSAFLVSAAAALVETIPKASSAMCNVRGSTCMNWPEMGS